MPKPKEPTTRIEDRARLGPNAAALKEKLRPARWRKIVKDAHRKGYKVEDYINTNLPDALKARTKESLREQALKTVQDAYKPAELELTQEEGRVKALDAKRARDESHFREWLTSQSDKLMAQAKAADDTLAGRQSEIATSVAEAGVAAREQAAQAAGATPGNVSDPKQSTALGSLAAATERSNEMVATQRTATAQAIGTGVGKMNITQAANLAALAAQDAKRQGDTYSALGKVSDARSKVKLDQAADASKEVARLLDFEAEKANKNREFDAVMSELGIKADEVTAKAKSDKDKLGLAKDKFKLDKWIAENKSKAEKLKLELGYAKIVSQEGKAAADRALKDRIERDRRAFKREENALDRADDGGKVTGGDRKYSSKQVETVDTIKADLERLHRKYPKGSTAQGKSFREVMLAKGYSNTAIDVAEDLRRHKGKLSPRGRQKARTIGILNPDKHFRG